MTDTQLKITDWALEDRPREKMMAQGADALSKAELMAILIGSGVPGTSAVELMRKVLGDYGNSLKQLGRATLQDLCAYNGIGEAKAVTILAACQLAQMRLKEQAEERKTITSSEDIYAYFLPSMQDLSHEECRMLLLKQNLTVIRSVMISSGGLTSSSFDVRMMLREALLAEAPVVALCHNHPSGNLKPSRQDDEMTEGVLRACKMMNIRLLDHVILTDGNWYSYADNQRL